ncbi:NEDD4-binding protein 2-like 2 [Phytophthora citrophthora]|uniref:NEDD4-binding protein 2-like 2 n=1 Tax=Phytophthora citrophthora TaxID=4793 RepID=A0AAD9FZL6_9STRA|nr:NEDD4-binding protein 2-like 2 [Phytophthora citrophthora]
MAWGKNRRSPSSSSGRRRPPGELTEQDILRSIQQSPVRVRVSLQLGAEDDTEPLKDLLSRFEQQFEARRRDAVTQSHHIRVGLLECGLHSWQHLLELQRVLAALKRPISQGEEAQLMSKTRLKHNAKYDEWMLSLGFNRASEDELWSFASSLMLRLKSCGVLSRVLLTSHRLTVPLETAFVEWGSMEVDKFTWEGKHTWSQVVVQLEDECREEIQRVFLPSICPVKDDPLAELRYPELIPLVDNMLSGNTDVKKPVVVILRGIPGSGKSTLGREIEVICRQRGVAFTACSADFFFETPKGYVFDVSKLGSAHSECKAGFTKAIHGDIPRVGGGRATQHVVLVDNTNTQRWEYETYENIAMSRGSHVHIVEMRSEDALMAYRMGQRNSHGVPPDKVVSMFMRWEEDPRAYSFTPQFEHARLTRNPLSDGDVGGLTYLGLFLDCDSQRKLLSEIPPVHKSTLADHITLFYRPNKQYTRDAELGASFTVRGVEVVQDDRGQTLRVELDDDLPLQVRNKIPHITISTVDGVSASYSNDLLDSASAKRTVLDPPIELTTYLGAALFIQNQRVISTSPPFGVDICSSKNVDEDAKKFQADTISRLFVLYVSESDLAGSTGEDATKLLWQGQILRSMGSRVRSRRLLCVQREVVSSSSSLHSILKTRSLFLPAQYFDDMVMIEQSPSFQGFEDTVSKYVLAPSFGRIAQFTLMTSVAESTQWPLHKMICLRDASLSATRIDLQEQVAQTTTTLSPACTTILSSLDILGINIQEEARSTIVAGIGSVRDAWTLVVGTDDRYAVQRMDTTLLGLSSSVVEVSLTLPHNTTSTDLQILETKLLRALNSSQSTRHIVRSCAPGQFYFSLSTLSSCALNFCVRMTSHPHNDGSDDVQLKFCETQLRVSREICDIEAYTVLVALLRAILLRCCSLLPSECRLSSLINLTSERLILHYLENIGGEHAIPTADEVTSGRIIFSLYDLLALLSKLSPTEWSTAFGDSLLELQGSRTAQTMWRQALENVARNSTTILASHRCVNLKQTTQLNPKDHVQVVVDLMKVSPTGNGHESPTRAYIEVSSRSTWSSLHSLACCDKLRSAAAMVLAQDDDRNNGDRLEFFTCAPSLVSRRVDVMSSSLDLLRDVLSKLDAIEGGSEGALSGDYTICMEETDEEIFVDLPGSG